MNVRIIYLYSLIVLLAACSLGKNFSDSDAVYEFPDEHSQFPGGPDKLNRYISSHVNYPEDAQQKGVQGKVYVAFIVEKNGSISNVEIVRGVSASINEEAMRVIRSMPDWKPALKDGLIVRSRARVPINFVLE
ncbi:MAG: energy transducer TonB [Bacteroidota bacterium]